MEFRLEPLAWLAGGILALAGVGTGATLRTAALKNVLRGPTHRLERLEESVAEGRQRQDALESAVASDLQLLRNEQRHLSEIVEKVSPAELQTRLLLVEQRLGKMEPEIHHQLADLRTSIGTTTDGLARVVAGQQEFRVALDEQLGRFQDVITQRLEQTQQLRQQVGYPVMTPPAPVAAVPGADASALVEMEQLRRQQQALQQEFASRQRQQAAEAFRQPAGGGM